MYKSKVVLDSIGKHGIRTLTYEIEMPKWLVAEFNTHRMLSRNSASSRAIPTEQIIERVMNDPVIPLDWRARNTGMQADKLLSEKDSWACESRWLSARDAVVKHVQSMSQEGDGVDKQRVNRMLEPWMWTVVVATATDWDNFFKLRDSSAAQPEFGYIARMMHEQHIISKPEERIWHMPYVEDLPYDIQLDILHNFKDLATISAAYCGRVSYYRQGLSQGIQKDYERGLSFAENGHWSPLEHAARVDTRTKVRWCEERNTYVEDYIRHGNLYGWKPLRKFFKDESGQPLTGEPVYADNIIPVKIGPKHG